MRRLITPAAAPGSFSKSKPTTLKVRSCSSALPPLGKRQVERKLLLLLLCVIDSDSESDQEFFSQQQVRAESSFLPKYPPLLQSMRRKRRPCVAPFAIRIIGQRTADVECWAADDTAADVVVQQRVTCIRDGYLEKQGKRNKQWKVNQRTFGCFVVFAVFLTARGCWAPFRI